MNIEEIEKKIEDRIKAFKKSFKRICELIFNRKLINELKISIRIAISQLEWVLSELKQEQKSCDNCEYKKITNSKQLLNKIKE